jgi:Tfp pilus assembly protein PilF
LAVVCLFGLGLHAQLQSDSLKTTLRGHISGEGTTYGEYTVALYSLSGNTQVGQALADPTGEFAVSGISEGDYRLIVTNREGAVLKEDLVRAGTGSPIEVRLQERTQPQTLGGIVTVTQLRHKAPKKAQQELQAAHRARFHNDQDASLAHLLRAVALDRQFADAHSDLAAQYITLKHYDLALVEADEAARLDPASGTAQLNRAVCLSRMDRLAEAETAARLARQLDPASHRSQYALGIILAAQKKFTPEAVDNLVQAGQAFPPAQLTAAQILLETGRASEAKAQLRRYLKNCAGKECEPVHAWLFRLNDR